MFRRPQYIVLSGVALLALVIIGLPKQTAGQVKLALSSLFLPLFGLAGATSKLGDKAANAALPRRVLENQIASLQKENSQLKFELAQYASITNENDKLRAAIGWQQRRPWVVKLAHVQIRDPANWWRTAEIDVGTSDAIAPFMPVLTPEGLLVGRVDEAGLGSSRIVLLGDPNCRVAAYVAETQEKGVIAPGSSAVLDQSLVDLTYLSRHSQAKPGHRVYTSGASGFFPKDIFIGRIADIESVGQGLYMEARVKVAADLQRLDIVWVVLSGARQ
jgi:rod shape-determining protein MreC